ncbi:MAG: nickel-dependent lactate racemase [Salinivirgaceae bacterium]|jgi:nickel-dependent lactate racemase|nr:nickel-dependent lactate racemase [Salinivirgaceae bacterium]
MKIEFHYGIEKINLDFPENTLVYQSNYKSTNKTASEMLLKSIETPSSGLGLKKLLLNRKSGNVVIVVSDITRPIPYSEFLPELITEIESSGVEKDEITILVATGMHRASTPEEHLKMFGEQVVAKYRIIDHNCEDESNLQELEGRSWSGAKVKLNKHYVEAGFRIITGLVEPHFMAGFSGGRKAICPGLVALNAVQKFHGYTFLSHPNASSTILKDNPCHDENTSIARMCAPDFAINIVLDNNKKVNTIISGELFESHHQTVEYVRAACCPIVNKHADFVITSSGGYPLDATFYQCVKGFVNCLSAVKQGGEIISFGCCIEGIGSPEYTGVMKKYSGNHRQFIDDIKSNRFFIKDQWQFQMHVRTLEKIGQQNLHFYTSAIPDSELSQLSVNPHSIATHQIEQAIQEKINMAIQEKKRIAIFPEGSYCSPTS